MGSAHLALRCLARSSVSPEATIPERRSHPARANDWRHSARMSVVGIDHEHGRSRSICRRGRRLHDSHIMSRWLPRWFSCARPEFAHVHPVCERGMNVTDQSVWQYGFARNRSHPAAIAAAGRMGTHHAVSSMIGLPSVPSPSRRAERHLDDKLARALLGSVFSASLDRSGAV